MKYCMGFGWSDRPGDKLLARFDSARRVVVD
jgi:hypothetical protein